MSEIEKLQQLLGHDIILPSSAHSNDDEFTWYRTSQGDEIGVNVSSLTTKEQELLDIFLTPLSQTPEHATDDQLIWYELLFKDHIPDQDSDCKQARLLHFNIYSQDIEHELFIESFQNMLSSEIISIWKDRYSGVIVEFSDDTFTPLEELNELLHTIESDLYLKSTLFIGSIFNTYTEAKSQYDKESKFYKMIHISPNKDKVFTLSKTLPHVLLDQAKSEDLSYFRQQFLNEIEPDLLLTVRTLLEYNLNFTLASKRLFIHRNSLQYRLEKFTELTGLDPKVFHEAVTIYLCLKIEE